MFLELRTDNQKTNMNLRSQTEHVLSENDQENIEGDNLQAIVALISTKTITLHRQYNCWYREHTHNNILVRMS